LILLCGAPGDHANFIFTKTINSAGILFDLPEENADILENTDNENKNCLHYACQAGNVEIAKKLIGENKKVTLVAKGAVDEEEKTINAAQIKQKSTDGNTPLHYAAQLKNPKKAHEIIKKIFDDGDEGQIINIFKPIHWKNNDQYSPLYFVLQSHLMQKGDFSKTIKLFDDKLTEYWKTKALQDNDSQSFELAKQIYPTPYLKVPSRIQSELLTAWGKELWTLDPNCLPK